MLNKNTLFGLQDGIIRSNSCLISIEREGWLNYQWNIHILSEIKHYKGSALFSKGVYYFREKLEHALYQIIQPCLQWLLSTNNLTLPRCFWPNNHFMLGYYPLHKYGAHIWVLAEEVFLKPSHQTYHDSWTTNFISFFERENSIWCVSFEPLHKQVEFSEGFHFCATSLHFETRWTKPDMPY